MIYLLRANNRISSRMVTAVLITSIFTATLLLLLYRYWRGEFGYTIGETLMNYSFGFYRRALIGNIFLPFHDKSVVLALLAFAYSGCLATPFLVIRQASSSRQANWIFLFLLFLLLSPFGTLFYLKSVGSLKKELFFYPIFLALLSVRTAYPRLTHLCMALAIVIGSLIHESFFFLFLPFLLAYSWLNDWLNWKGVALQAGVGVLTMGLLLLVPGNSAATTDRFVQQYMALGFPKPIFYYFEFYQKLTAQENLVMSVKHFRGTAPVLFFALYGAQFLVGWWLATHFIGRLSFQKPRELLIALGVIVGGVFCLCFIGMDYGRWLAVAFTASVILIASQIKQIQPTAPHRPLVHYVVLALFLAGWCLFLRIPGYTVSIWVERHDWFSLTNIFN